MRYRRRFFLCTGQVVLAEDAWKFAGSHILGDLRELGLAPSLALWLTPVDCTRVPPLHPEIAAYILGEARLIRCRFEGCGRRVDWEEGNGGLPWSLRATPMTRGMDS